MINLWDEVDKLAIKITAGAMMAPQEEQIEALKVLTAYRAASAKAKPASDGTEDGKVISFEKMKDAIASAGKEH